MLSCHVSIMFIFILLWRLFCLLVLILFNLFFLFFFLFLGIPQILPSGQPYKGKTLKTPLLIIPWLYMPVFVLFSSSMYHYNTELTIGKNREWYTVKSLGLSDLFEHLERMCLSTILHFWRHCFWASSNLSVSLSICVAVVHFFSVPHHRCCFVYVSK